MGKLAAVLGLFLLFTGCGREERPGSRSAFTFGLASVEELERACEEEAKDAASAPSEEETPSAWLTEDKIELLVRTVPAEYRIDFRFVLETFKLDQDIRLGAREVSCREQALKRAEYFERFRSVDFQRAGQHLCRFLRETRPELGDVCGDTYRAAQERARQRFKK